MTLYAVFDFKNNYFIIKNIENSSKIYVFALFEIFNVKFFYFLYEFQNLYMFLV